MIVGAADRLVTYGDIEYEQPTPKIWLLASHTVALVSGSPEDHATIASRTFNRVQGIARPTVEVIANIYAEEFANLRRDRAAKKYLAPLGLSPWGFLNSQTNLSPDVANRLVNLLQDEDLDGRAIITGIDTAGAHVFVVRNPGEAISHDLIGWAAIGFGSRHADSQFISEKYHLGSPFEDTLLLTYLAKKKADITPGVGAATDLFWIAQEGYRLLSDDIPLIQLIHKLHEDIDKGERALREDSKIKVRQAVKDEIKKQQTAKQEPAGQVALQGPPGTEAAIHSEAVRDGPENSESEN